MHLEWELGKKSEETSPYHVEGDRNPGPRIFTGKNKNNNENKNMNKNKSTTKNNYD